MSTKRIAALFVATVALLSTVMSSLAWQDVSQYKTNSFRGTADGGVEVILTCVLKDENGVIMGDPVTPVQGAEYQLYRVGENGDPDTLVEGGPWYTDASGQILFDGSESLQSTFSLRSSPVYRKLSVGKYYFIHTRPGYGYVYDKDESNNDITRYDFEITRQDVQSYAVITVPTYNRPTSGILEISKQVNGTGAPQDAAFTFHVEFANGKSDYPYKLYDKNGNIQFDGEYQFLTDGTLTLKDGEKAVFDTVWAGLGYTVREEYVGNYSTTSTGSQGTVPVPGEDTANQQKAQAVFVNTYDPNGETGDLTIAKAVSGDLSSAEDVFTFKVTFADNGFYSYRLNGAGTPVVLQSGQTLTLKHGQTAVFENLPVGLSYTVEELADDLGYTASTRKITGEIVSSGAAATFTNYKSQSAEPGSLSVSKAVTGTDKKDTFTFTVTFNREIDWTYQIYNGEETDTNKAGTAVSGNGTELTLKLTAGQKAVFSSLPCNTEYTVREIDIPAYYTPSTDKQQGLIPTGGRAEARFSNQYAEPSKSTTLTVGKTVEGEVPEEYRDTVFTFTVTIEGQAEPILLSLKNGEVSDPIAVPVGKGYTVEESLPSDSPFICTAVSNAVGTAGTGNVLVTFTNAYAGPVNITVTGVKKWVAPESISLPISVTLHLVNEATGEIAATTVAHKSSDYTFRFNVPKYDDEGKEITYELTETEVYGYTSTIEGNPSDGFVVTNTYSPESINKTQITVHKVWQDSGHEDVRPNDVRVQLYDGAVAVGQPVTLDENNNWSYTFEDLDAKGNWNVLELNVPEGYLSAVSMLGSDFVITNTYIEPGMASVVIEKRWDDQDNESKRPDWIEVQLLCDGTAYGEPMILSKVNGWRVTVPNLSTDRVYSAEEVSVPDGYTSKITSSGNNIVITNTYQSSPGDDPSSNIPGTGDSFDPTIWFIAMLVSVFVMWLLLPKYRKRHKYKHER